MRSIFRIKTKYGVKMDKNWEKLLEFIDPVYEYRILEFNEFKSLFNDFTIGLRDMKELNENIVVSDLLNHYKMRTLPIGVRARADKAEITDFSVIKGKVTDLYFVTFSLSPEAFNLICRYFRASDRTYRKYKVEFTKSERNLLWKLKNNDEWESNHKDWVSYSEQLDLSGEKRVLPLEQPFKNEKQIFESEYEFNNRIKKERWKERKERKNKKVKQRKNKKAVKTVPKLTNNGCFGYLDGKLVSFYKPTCKKIQKQKIKPVERVFWIKPEDNHWFEKKEKHLW